MVRRVIVIDPRDNVATATADLKTGDTVEVVGGQAQMDVLQGIPFGHKMALCRIAQGCPVIKYGQVIGTATRDIGDGEHVHVHNVDSMRGRGDIKREEDPE